MEAATDRDKIMWPSRTWLGWETASWVNKSRSSTHCRPSWINTETKDTCRRALIRYRSSKPSLRTPSRGTRSCRPKFATCKRYRTIKHVPWRRSQMRMTIHLESMQWSRNYVIAKSVPACLSKNYARKRSGALIIMIRFYAWRRPWESFKLRLSSER